MMMRVPSRTRQGARPRPSRRRAAWLAAVTAGLLSSPAALAQTPGSAPDKLPAAVTGAAPAPPAPQPAGGDGLPEYVRAVYEGRVMQDPNVVQAGCASCGGSLPIPAVLGGGAVLDGGCACGDGCGACACHPGRPRGCPVGSCEPPRTAIGKFISDIGACICCPDPCYEPVWVTTANAAFFQDTVRPKTYTAFRWDSARNLTQPDRAEFFWAREQAAVDANGNKGGRGPAKAESRVNYDELHLYQETAVGAFAMFIDTPYRSVYPEINDHHANFGDLNLGTKSLLIDCELLQLAFQFRTFIPVASPQNGIGTGHTSLEPSFLASLKLYSDTYLQAQVAEWIPIGGDRDYEGSVVHYHLSLNRLWLKKGACQVIGTAEFNGWTFQDGALTTLAAPLPGQAPGTNGFAVKASGETYMTLGGGLRLVFCENFDIGFGSSFAVTSDHFADQLYRTEIRLRY